MALRVKIAARAAAEVRRAAEWWEPNRLAAPGAIGKDFGEAVALLAEHPRNRIKVRRKQDGWSPTPLSQPSTLLRLLQGRGR